MNYAYIPITAHTCSIEQESVFMAADAVVPTDAESVCKTTETELEVRVGFQIYALTLMVFVGWCLLCIFLPTGMQAYPFDLVAQWVNRPKPMRENDFNYKKSELSKKVETLLQMGKKLIEDKKRLAERTRSMWLLSRWRAKSNLKAEQHLFETNCAIAEREFQQLDKIASYNTRVEPLKYSMLLILGILMGGISVLVIIHTFCYVALKVDGKTVEPFLNDLLEQTEVSRVGFLASVLLVAIGLFLTLCAVRGNVKLGLRFFFVSFYPILPKETFINSFLANCLVVNLWMVALIQFMNVLFRGYLRGTMSAKIFEVQVRNMYFFSWFFQNNVFVIWLIVWWFIAFIYLMLRPTEKIYLGSTVKRADLGSKQ